MERTDPRWQDIKARWVAALRSGEYAQGRGALRNEEGENCCIGVLCDVLNVPVETFRGDYSSGGEDLELNDPAYVLARDLIPIKGIPEEVLNLGGFTYGDTVDQLMSMNDATHSHKTFAEIADLIEEYL
jgi:hypothetical protein